MTSTLIHFIVVLCELYILFWVLAFFLGMVNQSYRWGMYPTGANLPGSVGSLIVAIAVVIVFGHGSFGF
jgi:hypothetical protein